MNAVTVNQAYLFLIFILNGLLIGIVFDIFRILRRSFKTPNIITYIEDALFWIISVSIILYSLFVFNNGEIRGFIFIGLLFGIALYMLFISKTIIKIFVKIVTFIKNIIYTIFKIIAFPIKKVGKILSKTIKKFGNLKNIKKSQKNLEKKEGF